MSGRDRTVAKLEAFLEVLDDLIAEALEGGLPAGALRRTLLARAVYECKADPWDGITALDHFRKALARELDPAPWPITG